MNTNIPGTKLCLFDLGINRQAKNGCHCSFGMLSDDILISVIQMALALGHDVSQSTYEDATITYHAVSQDETAILRWTGSANITLVARNMN